jgi:hypothetical protein
MPVSSHQRRLLDLTAACQLPLSQENPSLAQASAKAQSVPQNRKNTVRRSQQNLSSTSSTLSSCQEIF